MKGKYLYCITKELKSTSFSTQGIEGGLVHTVNWQEFSCVVSDTELEDKSISKEAAIAHEKVLEEVMLHCAIVPIAFGHVVESEEEIKTKLLESHKSTLQDLLGYLHGKIELSVKAFWLDLNPVLASISQTSEEIKRIKAKKILSRNDQINAGEIAAKLLGKKREETEEAISTIFKDIALEQKKCNLFGEQMITNLALLIDENDLEKSDKLMDKCEEILGNSNIKFKYTGPVPPYNFVQFNINVK